MTVLIGCPVYKRSWILPKWFEAIKSQDFPLEDIGFAFVVAEDDQETISSILNFAEMHPQLWSIDILIDKEDDHVEHNGGRRTWGRDRYQTMVRLRNELLNHAVCKNPDRYFSLDSDILLDTPNVLSSLVETTETHDAASPLMHMHPVYTRFPSVMSWRSTPGGVAYRDIGNYPFGELFKSDAIMAAKMMSKPVYQTVRYQWHRQGEDLGWSADAASKGFSLWCDSRLYCPHIMSKAALVEYEAHGDSRRDMAALRNKCSLQA